MKSTSRRGWMGAGVAVAVASALASSPAYASRAEQFSNMLQNQAPQYRAPSVSGANRLSQKGLRKRARWVNKK